MTGNPTPVVSPHSPGYRRYVLFALLVVYTLNFVDRQIVGIVAVPMKAELGLTDSQLGMLGGLAFALFYTLLGIPVARLADRFNRVWIMTVALGTWSLMTALCGFAQSFSQLFMARVGVGVGEAGGVSPAFSVLCDYFPKEQRARAFGIYSFGVPVGSALGILAGGYLISLLDWRKAFMVVGFFGVIITPILRLTVREPVRGQLDSGQRTVARASIQDVLRVLSTKPSFWAMSAGTATASMMSYGLLFWLPSYFVRSFDLPVLNASMAFGLLTLVGGVTGIWIGGVLGDRFGQYGKQAYGLIPCSAVACAIPLYALAISSHSLTACIALMLIPTALGLMWMGPVLSSIQQLVPVNMRSTASAIFLFLNSLIGIGLGSVLMGSLSDTMSARFGTDSLRYAMLSSLGVYGLSAIFFALAARRLSRDWEA